MHRLEDGNGGVFFDPSDEISQADFSAPLIASLDKLLAQLTAAGIEPVLIMDVPEMGYDVPQALAKALMTGAKGSDAIASTCEAVWQPQAMALQVLSAAIAGIFEPYFAAWK